MPAEAGIIFVEISMKILHWLFENLKSLVSHSLGVAILMGAWTMFKSIRDDNALSYYWQHPGELASPAVVSISILASIALLRVCIKQRRMLVSFGVRLFSQHDNDHTKKADWDALKKDLSLASDDRSPLWILGATGKETFSGGAAPLFDVLRTYQGTVHILLVRPRSYAFTTRCQHLKVSEESYLDEILDSIDYCKDLHRKGAKIELRLYEGIPIWKMFMTTRVLWVQYYKPGTHVDNTPMYCFEYKQSSPTLFDGFRSAFQKRWSLDGSHLVDLQKFLRAEWHEHC